MTFLKQAIQFLLKLLGWDREPAPPKSSPPPTPSRWQPCLDWVLKMEGGFVDDPRDPGGATNKGITISTLSAFLGRQATVEEVRNMTTDLAGRIYYHDYWHANRCDEMPPGLDLALFDACVMSGARNMRMLLQQALGVAADGAIGPETMAAVEALTPEHTHEVIVRFCNSRLAYLQTLSAWADFENGWTRRVNDTMDAAMKAVI